MAESSPVQTQVLKRTGFRTVVFLGLLSLVGGVLYTGWHSGDLTRLLAALRHWLETSSSAAAETSPHKESVATGDDTAAAWRAWLAQGRRWSSGISQVIAQHVPKAAVAMAQQAAAAADAVIAGPHFEGTYSFHQTVTVIPGTPWWPDSGGGGGDCHTTNGCGGGGTNCHQTNTCGGGGHHDVSESGTLALLASGIAAFGVLRRRRVRPAKAP